ncbi:MAG TPA: glutamate--tRNA ligase family protein [Puia sp.]|nr:glutamate--tRNA ligase family protein [Puia sp.]
MSSPRSFRRTRIAPTPSGFLHLGNAYSFKLTADLARRTGAKILLRIDDLDRERVEERYIEDIFDTLHFLDIPWDEGPCDGADFERVWSQLHRMELYHHALEALRQQGVLFACVCSRTQIARESAGGVYPGTCRDKGLSLDSPDVSWRVRTDMGRELTMQQLEAPAFKGVLDMSLTDFVVRKKDGFPAYQLTSLVDDLHFGADLIVRGRDLWSSTLAQLYLAELLPRGSAFSAAVFHHHALFTNADGSKLSKSGGAASIQFLRREGKSPDEIYGLMRQIR